MVKSKFPEQTKLYGSLKLLDRTLGKVRSPYRPFLCGHTCQNFPMFPKITSCCHQSFDYNLPDLTCRNTVFVLLYITSAIYVHIFSCIKTQKNQKQKDRFNIQYRTKVFEYWKISFMNILCTLYQTFWNFISTAMKHYCHAYIGKFLKQIWYSI